MRKLAANYLVSDTGSFLKNGIVLVGEDGLVARYIDTKDNIREVEQLIFHNGILLAGCQFTRINASQEVSLSGHSFESMALPSVAGYTQYTLQNMVELCKRLQHQFPEMKIPEIFNGISKILFTECGFLKETLPGIYLLSSVDLIGMHFTPQSRLKKIL
ncbi:MAG TPA: hypothetical protein DCL77_01280 [Prolixibacteraceae bacterium]|jgi:hypothetical protein|nr:hypothetical protein [Prolixibacteraceae bacterium]